MMMKLRQANQQKEIAAAQIINVSGSHVTVKTENGRIMRLKLSHNNQQDQALLASLKDIWQNRIWIPVNTKLHRLFKYDWVVEPAKIND